MNELKACGAFVEVVLTGSNFDSNAPPVKHIWSCSEKAGLVSPSEFYPWLRQPPTELANWLNRIDPTNELTFIGDHWTDVGDIFGRPVHGWRRPEWAAFEDKTQIDAFWRGIGVASPAHEIVPCQRESVLTAFTKLDQGDGVVVSIDSSRGHNMGCQGLIWIKNSDALLSAFLRFSTRSKQVRIARFVHGVPCSILGFVAADGVAVFEPIEIVTLGELSKTRFLFCGSSTRWRPESKARDLMRHIARQAGEALAKTVKYRGIFSVDGILQKTHFVATELNPRHASGLGLRAGCPEFPIYLFNRAIHESIPGVEQISCTEIESHFCEQINSHPSHSITVLSDPTPNASSAKQSLRLQKATRFQRTEQVVTYTIHRGSAHIQDVHPLPDDGRMSEATAALATQLTGCKFAYFSGNTI
jgi:hypothetical protein